MKPATFLSVPAGSRFAESRVMPPRHSVYIIQSDHHPERFYTGLTSDVTARLAAHNAGMSTHTATGTPWRLVLSMTFADPEKAKAFEGYLKSGSGRAFAARHFR